MPWQADMAMRYPASEGDQSSGKSLETHTKQNREELEILEGILADSPKNMVTHCVSYHLTPPPSNLNWMLMRESLLAGYAALPMGVSVSPYR